MKAIIKKHFGPGLDLVTNYEIPKIKSNEVLIKITKTAICGTDVHIEKWDKWAQNKVIPPLIIGHEFVGIVVALGENTKNNNIDIKIGDRVSAEGHLVCEKCELCRREKKHYCPFTKGIGYDCQGVFAEYVSIPIMNIWKPNPIISDDEIVCFDPFGNTVHTIFSFNIAAKNILITGAGPIGCMAAAICKHLGAKNIIVTDINSYRLSLAQKMGANIIFNTKNLTIQECIKKLNIGIDIGFEMSGAELALNQMISVMNNGGKIAILGLIPADTKINWTNVIFKQILIKGIYGRKIFETWYQGTSMLESGLNIKPVITHKFHYTQYKQAFDLMKSGLCGKIILEWD